MISVPFELKYVEFGIFIPGIPLPEKVQKGCSLKIAKVALLSYSRFLPTLKTPSISIS